MKLCLVGVKAHMVVEKSKLPKNAIAYINRIEELVETPVAVLSTSPERDDTILIQDPFK